MAFFINLLRTKIWRPLPEKWKIFILKMATFSIFSRLAFVNEQFGSRLKWRDFRRLESAGLILRKPGRINAPVTGRVAFSSALSENFLPGLQCLILSVLKHNPGFNFPFYIFTDDKFSDLGKNRLLEIYEHFIFIQVDQAKYEGIKDAHFRISKIAYYALESFGLTDFDKVIYLDADLLCLGPIDELLHAACDFGVCRDIGASMFPYLPIGSRNHLFNSGMMVIGKKFLNAETHGDLLALANQNPVPKDIRLAQYCDQRVLNLYFADKDIQFLPTTFNCLKRLYKSYKGFDLGKIALLHYVGAKPWIRYEEVRPIEMGYANLNQLWKEEYETLLKPVRVNSYRKSGSWMGIEALRDAHRGRRAFIIGNGPSLKQQDLLPLRDEITFVTNWFGLHPMYEAINPKFYCICSHTVFGGWDVDPPKIQDDFHRMLLGTRDTIKILSYRFRPYVERHNLFPGHDVRYLLFEKPFKRFLDSKKDGQNLDLSLPVDDAHTVILSFCVPLAVHMGIQEIYLIGCDSDYGIDKQTGEKKYFYPSEQHKTECSSHDHLQRVWANSGPVFQSFKKSHDTLAERGVMLLNATAGGRLDVLPRVRYESLFQA